MLVYLNVTLTVFGFFDNTDMGGWKRSASYPATYYIISLAMVLVADILQDANSSFSFLVPILMPRA